MNSFLGLLCEGHFDAARRKSGFEKASPTMRIRFAFKLFSQKTLL